MILSKKLLLRRRYIVDKHLQYNLISRMVVYVIFTFVAMSILLFGPLIREMNTVKNNGKPSDESVGALLYMHEHFWPVALLCLVVAIVGAMLVSHRLAGPLVRVKRVMRFVTEGHFPKPLKTRTRDYFKTEVDLLNEMVASLAARIDAIKAASRAAENAVADYEAMAGTPEDPQEAAALDEVKERVQALDDLLAGFTSQRDSNPEELPEPSLDPEPESKPETEVTVRT